MDKPWKPSDSDINWMAKLIELIKDGGAWGTDFAVFKVDKTTKTLLITSRQPDSTEDISRVRLVAAQLGYGVV